MAPIRLAFLAAGLGALGLAALMLVAVGTYRPEKTKLMQVVKTLKHPAHLEQAKRFGVVMLHCHTAFPSLHVCYPVCNSLE